MSMRLPTSQEALMAELGLGGAEVDALHQGVSEDVLAAALEANFAARFCLYRWWPRAVVCDGPDLFWDLTDLPLPSFNNVLRARLPEAGVDAAIGQATARCLRAGVPMNWWVGPATRRIDLPSALEAHGFQRVKAGKRWPWQPTCRRLTRRRSGRRIWWWSACSADSDLAAWVDVLAASFGFPTAAREPFVEATMAALRTRARAR